MGRRGIPAMIGMVAALLVWAVHFLAIYGAQATACVRAAPDTELFGQPLVPTLVLGLTAVALLAVAAVGLLAWRRLPSGMTAQAGEEQPRFLRWLTVGTALFAALAILWETLPVLVLPPCG
jgi:amino acid transporter